MREVKRYFLRILQVELEDLEEEIQRRIQECEAARCAHRSIEHVPLGNKTVFENELLGIQDFRRLIRALRIDRFASLDEMIRYLHARFHEIVKSHGLAEAIMLCIDHRLEKVARYVGQ